MAERSEFSAQNARPLRLRFFRKRQREVAHPYAAQTNMQKINRPANADRKRPCQRPRQNPQNFDERPRRRVFKFSPHPGSVTVSPRKFPCQTLEGTGLRIRIMWGQPPSAVQSSAARQELRWHLPSILPLPTSPPPAPTSPK